MNQTLKLYLKIAGWLVGACYFGVATVGAAVDGRFVLDAVPTMAMCIICAFMAGRESVDK